MNAWTKRLRTLIKARRRDRDRRVRAIGRPIDKVTRRLEDRIIAIVNRPEGGEVEVLAKATGAWMDSTQQLSDVAEVSLRDLWDWSYDSAGLAFVEALPMKYWLVKTAPVGRLTAQEGIGGTPAAVSVTEALDWNEQYEHIVSGAVSEDEARELVRQYEFPPPTPERVNQILEDTNDADGLSAMERIKTVEPRHIPELQQLIVDSFVAQAKGKASAVDYLSPRLRQLVGNDPGKSTGMNYRAKRIARTEGVRIAEDGLREVWKQAGDIVEGIQWFSARVADSRWVDHEERHEKIYPPTAVPTIPAGPNCLCFSSPVLADDLTKGLPPENLGAWYDDSVLRAEKERAPKKRKAAKVGKVPKKVKAAKRDEPPNAALVVSDKGYPSVMVDGKPIAEHYSDDDIELITDELGDIDDVVASIALGGEYDEASLDVLPSKLKSEVLGHAKKLRKKLEFVPAGESFNATDGETFFRINKGEMKKGDLHDKHTSRLWIDDDGTQGSTRKGLSTTATVDDLSDYFAGETGTSLGRGARFDGSYVVELRGNKSGDVPYESSSGEKLIHPTAIVKQRKIEDTDIIRRTVERARATRGDEGIITYDSKSDEIVRLTMKGGRVRKDSS